MTILAYYFINFNSIISGFAVPLREEHVYVFKTVIIPLHKVQTCQLYHEQLLRCSMLFLSKDPSLAILVMTFINTPSIINIHISLLTDF